MHLVVLQGVAISLRREGRDDAQGCACQQPWVDDKACDKQHVAKHKQRHRNDVMIRLATFLCTGGVSLHAQDSSSAKDMVLRSPDAFCAMAIADLGPTSSHPFTESLT